MTPDDSGAEVSEWDEQWSRKRQMPMGHGDPLIGFWHEVKQAMEDVGNEIGRPCEMEVEIRARSTLDEDGDADE